MATSLLTEQDFLCPICLDVFTKPMTLPCGHNYCQSCIKDYWDSNNVCLCPVCKEKFLRKPELSINRLIADMAEKFRKSIQGNHVVKPDQLPQQPGSAQAVECDLCAGAKVPAVKSCLVCLLSYCTTHLEPHQKKSALMRHKLINPVKNLESRICKEHDRPLEHFCRADEMLLCEACTEVNHKRHKIVPLEEEIQSRKGLLALDEAETYEIIRKRQQKIDEIRHSVQNSRANTDKAMLDSAQVMNALMFYIKKSQAELHEVIEARQVKVEMKANGIIKQLEEEITRLERKKTALQQVSVNEDHLEFLHSTLALGVHPPLSKDLCEVRLDAEQLDVLKDVAQLKVVVMREVRLLCDPAFKEVQRHAVDVTLDPDTANPMLTLSNNGKEVKHGDTKRNIPNTTARFDRVLNVLAKEGFSSGKFYYEVEVNDKPQWDLGVANQSINRKGDIRLSPKSGYWTIWLRKGYEYTANTGTAIILPLRRKPKRVGVFVDYDRGVVSFYDVEARAQIYSFTGCAFTEKVFPFFSPCANEGGQNSSPLIITPVNIKSFLHVCDK